MSITAIIPAAGQGRRFGGPLPKQYATLVDRPVIEYTLAAVSAARVNAIVVAVAAEYIDDVTRKLRPKFPKLAAVVAGGDCRQDTVRMALDAVDGADDDLVAVHDAARPFVRPSIFNQCIDVAMKTGGCICARPVVDTMKRVRFGEEIAETVDRAQLWSAQTPQIFRRGILRQAMQRAVADGVAGTDEAMCVERIGGVVRVVIGDTWNFKITTPEDLALATAIVQSKLLES